MLFCVSIVKAPFRQKNHWLATKHKFIFLLQVIDTQTKLYLVLELGDGGDMYDYIMKHEGGLGEETARKYFRQIVTAIQYCHKLHVVHRDLKPENVVFFEKLGMVKLTDFGFSNKFNPGAKLLTSCGSLAYSAPEILLGDAYDAPAVGENNNNTKRHWGTVIETSGVAKLLTLNIYCTLRPSAPFSRKIVSIEHMLLHPLSSGNTTIHHTDHTEMIITFTTIPFYIKF